MTTISNSTKVIDDIDLYAKLLLSVKIGDRKDSLVPLRFMVMVECLNC